MLESIKTGSGITVIYQHADGGHVIQITKVGYGSMYGEPGMLIAFKPLPTGEFLCRHGNDHMDLISWIIGEPVTPTPTQDQAARRERNLKRQSEARAQRAEFYRNNPNFNGTMPMR